MASINFPAAPFSGDVFTANGRSWVRSIKGWKAAPVAESLQAQLNTKAPALQPLADKSLSYTLQSSDANTLIRSTDVAITITVPDVLNDGQRVDFIQAGAGQITFAGSGITLNSADSKLLTAKQYSGATIFKAGEAYYLIGNLG